MRPGKFVKIQTFCPKESVDKIRLAIGEAGGGNIGNYSHCVFLSSGKSFFKPLVGANPTVGKIGEISEVEEIKIEFICEQDKAQAVIAAIKKAHPYEEAPVDIFQMLDLD